MLQAIRCFSLHAAVFSISQLRSMFVNAGDLNRLIPKIGANHNKCLNGLAIASDACLKIKIKPGGAFKTSAFENQGFTGFNSVSRIEECNFTLLIAWNKYFRFGSAFDLKSTGVQRMLQRSVCWDMESKRPAKLLAQLRRNQINSRRSINGFAIRQVSHRPFGHHSTLIRQIRRPEISLNLDLSQLCLSRSGILSRCWR
ncbi:MAG TPA: hypothetical protein PLK30_07095 [Blastocatellia bacterium]|nr:hypothetical protein [Blastocatellia bacterium]